MIRKPCQVVLLAVSFVFAIFLAACGNGKAVVRYVTITPAGPTTLNAGFTQQFTAKIYFSDGTIQDGTLLVSWSSSDQTVATITSGGLASGLTGGTTSISAAYPGTSGATVMLTVNQLLSIAVNPPSATISFGGTQPFTAAGTYQNVASPVDLTSLVAWSSQTPAIATIDNTGLATAGSMAGTTQMSATLWA